MKTLKTLFFSLILLLSLSTGVSAEYFKDIIISGPNGVWIDPRAYTSLSAAITAAGASERTIVISTPLTTTNLTIPANITLEFLRDGMITDTGTLTLNTKKIIAPSRQIFGNNQIAFATGSVVRSSWFSSTQLAIFWTSTDTLTLIIDKAATLTGVVNIGANVTLEWQGPGNILTADAGASITNIGQIQAGNYQLFAGAGDFRFRDGTNLNLSWFPHLRSAITWITTNVVTLTIPHLSVVDFSDNVGSNITLDFSSQSGSLSISPGISIDITTPMKVIAPVNRQIFYGTGTVTFSTGGILPAAWFEPFTQVGITKALTSIGSLWYTLFICPGPWNISTALAFPSNVTVDMPSGSYFIGAARTAGTITGLTNVTPEQFGAVGDGATDDYVAIWAALRSLKTTGGEIKFSGKTYATNSNIEVNYTDWLKPVHFKGAGPGRTIIQDLRTGTGYTVWLNLSGSTIRDLSIKGQWDDGEPFVSCGSGLYLGNNVSGTVYDLLVDNVEVSNYNCTAMVAGWTSRMKLSKLYVHDAYSECLLVGWGCNGYTVTDSVFEKSRFMVDLGGSYNGVFSNNIINRALDAYNTCGLTIERVSVDMTRVGDIVVSNNVFNDIGDIGINISGVATVYNITLSNNIIKANTTADAHWGIGITIGDAQGVKITGGSIQDCLTSTSTANTEVGIWLLNSNQDRITISDVDFWNVSHAAVRIGQSAQAFTYSNVNIVNNRMHTVGTMVQFSDVADRPVIYGNSVNTATNGYVFTETPTNGVFGQNYWTAVTNEIVGTAPLPTGTTIIQHLDKAGNLQYGSFWTGEKSDVKVRSFARNYLYINVDTTLSEAHSFVEVAAGTAVGLPDPATCYGREYYIKQSGAGTVVITPVSGTINGGASHTLTTDSQLVGVISNGVNDWRVTFH